MQAGITPYAAALDLLQNQQWLHINVPYKTEDVFEQGFVQLLLTESYRDHRVARIILISTESTRWGLLGQVVAQLGPPQGVVVKQEFTQSFWHDGQLEFVHRHRLSGFVSVDDPLESITITAKPVKVPVSMAAWKGFGSVQAYFGSRTTPSPQ